MSLYLTSAPRWVRKFFPGCVWDIKTNEKKIYLTFDDGPHPVITPFVLNELKKYNAKATFFCIGNNVKKYPEVFSQTIAGGHTVGNHTMHHVNGWKCDNEKYVKDVYEAREYINTKLFRPPYGRIRRSQLKIMSDWYDSNNKNRFKIIMWSVLAGDWEASLTGEKCFEKIERKIYPGCIVVFHDSEKAFDRLKYALPKLLAHYSAQGYSFDAL
jgi:peptidoglycan-N-acetylglucosamine deacetylase